MKKFINRPEDVVEEMLDGLLLLNPGLSRVAGHKAIVRADADQLREQQVSIISGGGSGHEPAHADYVGAGMLSAAIAGEVFTSPSSDAVFAAIKATAGKPGALLVVKNYTGDRLNFGLAAEMARAEGIAVEMLLVDDDVALKDTEQRTGARGLAGTIFIHKLVGAAADEGKNLADITAIGRAAVRSLATMGVSLSAGTSPAVGKPSFELAEDEMELGLGIHGEPGVKRAKLQPANELTETLLDQILQHGRFDSENRIAVMINNLGATTPMELAILARHAVQFLRSKGLTVERVYTGSFLTSLDMAGVSISLLGIDDQRLRWLDAPTAAPAWPTLPRQPPPTAKAAATSGAHLDNSAEAAPAHNVISPSGIKLRHAIEAACHALIAASDELTELDRITGDGDLGSSMERAARVVLRNVNSYPLDSAAATMKSLAHTARRELGGSSGPLYGVLLLRCGTMLENSAVDLASWAEALTQGIHAISELGGAKPGDRTMLDALDPFVQTLRQAANKTPPPKALLVAVEAAERAAEATANMRPRLGRSSYLGDRVLGYPDPGAKAVAILLRAICSDLFTRQS
jgi:triose/dihydroxyacetone kinase / FAD-AMP lyase (cyclizing)